MAQAIWIGMEKIQNLWFDESRIYIRTESGKKLSRPLEAFPELKEANAEQRNAFVIDLDGEEVRWEILDADLHVSSFLDTNEPNSDNEVAKMFQRFPWLSVTEVARSMDIHPSLLFRYIYGMATPTPECMERMRAALRQFGRELQTA